MLSRARLDSCNGMSQWRQLSPKQKHASRKLLSCSTQSPMPSYASTRTRAPEQSRARSTKLSTSVCSRSDSSAVERLSPNPAIQPTILSSSQYAARSSSFATSSRVNGSAFSRIRSLWRALSLKLATPSRIGNATSSHSSASSRRTSRTSRASKTLLRMPWRVSTTTRRSRPSSTPSLTRSRTSTSLTWPRNNVTSMKNLPPSSSSQTCPFLKHRPRDCVWHVASQTPDSRPRGSAPPGLWRGSRLAPPFRQVYPGDHHQIIRLAGYAPQRTLLGTTTRTRAPEQSRARSTKLSMAVCSRSDSSAVERLSPNPAIQPTILSSSQYAAQSSSFATSSRVNGSAFSRIRSLWRALSLKLATPSRIGNATSSHSSASSRRTSRTSRASKTSLRMPWRVSTTTRRSRPSSTPSLTRSRTSTSPTWPRNNVTSMKNLPPSSSSQTCPFLKHRPRDCVRYVASQTPDSRPRGSAPPGLWRGSRLAPPFRKVYPGDHHQIIRLAGYAPRRTLLGTTVSRLRCEQDCQAHQPAPSSRFWSRQRVSATFTSISWARSFRTAVLSTSWRWLTEPPAGRKLSPSRTRQQRRSSRLSSRPCIPVTVTSDRGTQFTSEAWRKALTRLGINLSSMTSYHPQSNGIVEKYENPKYEYFGKVWKS